MQWQRNCPFGIDQKRPVPSKASTPFPYHKPLGCEMKYAARENMSPWNNVELKRWRHQRQEKCIKVGGITCCGTHLSRKQYSSTLYTAIKRVFLPIPTTPLSGIKWPSLSFFFSPKKENGKREKEKTQTLFSPSFCTEEAYLFIQRGLQGNSKRSI